MNHPFHIWLFTFNHVMVHNYWNEGLQINWFIANNVFFESCKMKYSKKKEDFNSLSKSSLYICNKCRNQSPRNHFHLPTSGFKLRSSGFQLPASSISQTPVLFERQPKVRQGLSLQRWHKKPVLHPHPASLWKLREQWFRHLNLFQ